MYFLIIPFVLKYLLPSYQAFNQRLNRMQEVFQQMLTQILMQRMAAMKFIFLIICSCVALLAKSQKMDELWGAEKPVRAYDANDQRFSYFDKSNYAMFVHMGLYSNLAGLWNGKTYYGISEWIMSKQRADISVATYKKIAGSYNPKKFDADAIARLAKEAGMKYIVITAKHHDGFSMFNTKFDDFNIVKSTPYGKDPMKELSQACKKYGLGLGFYYSHNQDWTFPGGNGGPKLNEKGAQVGFDYYFEKKCYPQINELTSNYGKIALIWFDTPGGMDEKYIDKLVTLVRKNQPGAMISGRIGNGKGDYQSLGDMNIPVENLEGLWETVDVTNDSWGYAWYDNNWKNDKTILTNTISTIARGGTYMLNIGPTGDGSVPFLAQEALKRAGKWIAKYPYIIYDAKPSPWGHAFPWGDAVVNNDKIYLLVYDWPRSGKLHVPGVKNVSKINILNGSKVEPLDFKLANDWLEIKVPYKSPESLVTVIELSSGKNIKISKGIGVDAQFPTEVLANQGAPHNVKIKEKRWMEKFGEWKHISQAEALEQGGYVEWEMIFKEKGYYHFDINYSGTGRMVWAIETSEGQLIQNEQPASHIYNYNPIGALEIKRSGKVRIRCKLIDGNREKASMKSLKITSFF